MAPFPSLEPCSNQPRPWQAHSRPWLMLAEWGDWVISAGSPVKALVSASCQQSPLDAHGLDLSSAE